MAFPSVWLTETIVQFARPPTWLSWGPGGYANAGEDTHVGMVPVPGGFALRTLGAVGIRRKRAA